MYSLEGGYMFEGFYSGISKMCYPRCARTLDRARLKKLSLKK